MRLLNRANFAVLHAVSKEESRYTLNAMHLDEDCTAATDGHLLITVSHPKARPDNFLCIDGLPNSGADTALLIHVEDAKKIAKSIPRRTTMPILHHAAICRDDKGVARAGVTDLDSPTVTLLRAV